MNMKQKIRAGQLNMKGQNGAMLHKKQPVHRKSHYSGKNNYKNARPPQKIEEQLSQHWSTPAPNAIVEYNMYQSDLMGIFDPHLSPMEVLVLEMFTATYVAKEAEIKMEEFQDFYERHFDKDNSEQKKEMFDIILKNELE